MEILPLIHSIWTIVVMVLFLGIVVWAYSSKRQVKFDEAARLPLDDDDSIETMAKEKRHV
jgi:cytochrome c oxidase cbb3-type subunit 4